MAVAMVLTSHHIMPYPQQTRHVEPMLVQCWADVVDGGPTLTQNWFNVSSLLVSLPANHARYILF